MKSYTKKPVTIQAVIWDGNNLHEVQAFVGDGNWKHEPCGNCLGIITLEGEMMATQGDYIIKGVKGEFYPCKPDIFALTYNETGSGMSFSDALAAVKNGKIIARSGWNGKDQFVMKAGEYKVPAHLLRAGTVITKEFLEARGLDAMEIAPHLDLWNSQNVYVSGWAPSQGDLFANDWIVTQ
jgi:hypothetical protein